MCRLLLGTRIDLPVYVVSGGKVVLLLESPLPIPSEWALCHQGEPGDRESRSPRQENIKRRYPARPLGGRNDSRETPSCRLAILGKLVTRSVWTRALRQH